MRKLILFIALLGLSISTQAQSWMNMGNTLQRQTNGTYSNYRFNLGSPGFMYFYNITQTDSLFNIAVSSGVTSFNTRTGVVTLLSADVTTALGFTPVPNTRQLINGYAITGGGTLATDRTIAVDSTLVQTIANFFPKADTRYVTLSGSYVNPSWITSLPWSKITATPTTLSGYGITDAVPSLRTVAGFPLSSNVTLASLTNGYGILGGSYDGSTTIANRIDTTVIVGKPNLASQMALKLSKTDTTTMLSNLVHKAGIETITGGKVFQNNAITTTTANIVSLVNTTPATLNNQKYSPALMFGGMGWGITAGASQSVLSRFYLQPNQGTTAGGQMNLDFATGGTGTYTTVYTFSAGGITQSLGSYNMNTFGQVAQVDAFVASNTLASSSGAPMRYSGIYRMSGTAYDLGTTASKAFNAYMQLRPVSANPATSSIVWALDNGSGTYTDRLTLSNSGDLGVSGNITAAGATYSTGGSTALVRNTTSGRFETIANTGTGNNVLSDAPTFTSTIIAAAANLSGNLNGTTANYTGAVGGAQFLTSAYGNASSGDISGARLKHSSLTNDRVLITQALRNNVPVWDIGTSITDDYYQIGRYSGGAIVDYPFKISQSTGVPTFLYSPIVSTTPTTSAGTYDILTRNTSTGIIEKISSSLGNFANTNLTFTGNRVHDLGSYALTLSGSSGAYKTKWDGYSWNALEYIVRNSSDGISGSIMSYVGGGGGIGQVSVNNTNTDHGFIMSPDYIQVLKSPTVGGYLKWDNITGNFTKTIQFPDANGTVALTSDTPIAGSFSGVGTATTTFTVTIGATQANTTYKVNVTPTSLVAAAVFYVTNKTTSSFDVVYLAGLTGAVSFDWSLFR